LKVQHWRGFQSIYAPNAAPVPDFDFHAALHTAFRTFATIPPQLIRNPACAAIFAAHSPCMIRPCRSHVAAIQKILKLFTIIRDHAAAGRSPAGWLLRPLFGSISWNAPPWAQWLSGRAGALAVTVKARPLHALLALLVAVAIGAGGVWTWKWWQARPKPVEVAVSVENPARTPIENEDEADRGPRLLLVKFAQSVAPLSMAEKEVPSGIITPPLEGKWKWTDEQQLEFQPGRLAGRQEHGISLTSQCWLAYPARVLHHQI
jgi:hypothetical protein